MVEIPPSFAHRITSREGESGRTWLEELPDLVAEFLERWHCVPTGPITGGGVGIILPVRRHDGTPAVLKISFTHLGNSYEAHAFATWRGRGAVLLYERDDVRFAMLLGQAEWQTLDKLGDVDRATAIAGELARRLAIPAPPDLPRLSEQIEEWDATLREAGHERSHPLSQRAVDGAIAAAEDLVHNQPDTMVHGDLHFGNIVSAQREPWLVVDPKGWAGDPAFDTITVLARGVESLRKAEHPRRELRRRLAIFADAAEIDRSQVIRWVQVRTTVRALRNHEDPNRPWVIPLLTWIADELA